MSNRAKLFNGSRCNISGDSPGAAAATSQQIPWGQAALAQARGGDTSALCLTEALAVYHAQAAAARRAFNGRELMLFESHPEKIGRLIDLLIEGTYDVTPDHGEILGHVLQGETDALFRNRERS